MLLSFVGSTVSQTSCTSILCLRCLIIVGEQIRLTDLMANCKLFQMRTNF